MVQINALTIADGNLRRAQTVSGMRGMSLDKNAKILQFGPPQFRALWGRDYVIKVEGERVGRLLYLDSRTVQDIWVWVLTGFGYGVERMSVWRMRELTGCKG
jgi:hypothetical protein